MSEIHGAQWFSFIVDEATDVSQKEQMPVCIRWVDEDFTIHEDPLELIHLPNTDAETLTSAIKDCLIRFSLTITQCRGQAFDGASSMSGHLTDRNHKRCPYSYICSLLCSRTNISLQSVARQSIPVRDAIDLLSAFKDSLCIFCARPTKS